MFLLIAPGIATALALSLIPLVRRFGLKWGWTDQPGKRKVHQQPIVRVGGIAIFAGTLFAILLALLFSNLYSESAIAHSQIAGILLGGAGFFLIGLGDDIFQLSPFVRLLLQGLVVWLSWSLGVQVEALPVPFVGAVSTGLLSLPITFFWLAGVANAINWIDGLDGLAGGVSLIAALTFSLVCWHNPVLVLIALALAGALIGFLRYNLTPAKIFMGDGGSYFVGFILASLGTVGLMQSSSLIEVSLPFLILAVPIADMISVIGSRLWDRKSPFYADQRHLHHKLLKANVSVQAAVQLIWCLTAWFSSWSLTLFSSPFSAIALFFTSLLLAASSHPLWSSRLTVLARSR